MSRECPILFSAPMVRAILEGRKTMTRRVVKKPEQFEIDEDGKFCFSHSPDCGGYCDYACACAGEVIDGHIGWTPYGSNPNHWSRLWVRETFAYNTMLPKGMHTGPNDLHFKATCDRGRIKSEEWRSPFFLPRWGSRITLKITSIRVERLQDVTEADVIKEGCPDAILYGTGWFKTLWDEINGGKHPWASNPWVWVYSFEQVKP